MTEAKVFVRAGVAGVDSIRGLGRELGGLQGQLRGLGLGMSYFRTALSVAGVVAWTKSIINGADEAGKLAQRVGSTAEAISGLQYAARIGDVEDLAGSLDRLNRVLGQAADGSKRQTAALKAVGVSAKEIRDGSIDTVEVLLRTAEAFADMPDGVQKATLAQELFGRSGAQLIPFLNQGRDGIEALTAEAERLGVVVSTQTAAAADEFNDNLTRLGARAQGFGLSVANDLLPTLTDITEGFLEIVGTESESVGFFAAVGEAARILAAGLVTVVAALKTLVAGFVTVGRMAGAFLAGGMDAALDEAEAGRERLKEITLDWAEAVTKITEQSRLFGNGPRARTQAAPRRRTGGYDLDLQTDTEEKSQQRLLERSQKALAEYQAFSENYTAQLNFETKAITQNNDERELSNALKEIDLEAVKQMAHALPDEIDAIQGVAQALKELTREQLAYKQAVEKSAGTGFKQFMNELRDTATNDAKLIKDALSGAFNSAGDALAEFVTTSKLNFKDFVRSLLADFARLMAQRALAQMVSSFFPVAHAGGVIGADSLPQRSVPTSVFAGAPRYHSGGVIGSGEVPTILKKGEGVFTPAQMKAMGGSSNSVTVNVNMTTGQTETKATEADADRLGRAIANVVRQTLVSEQRPGGLLATA